MKLSHVLASLIIHSNIQKRAKKARHEREKEYMERLLVLGHAVGEYAGDGQGETEDRDTDAVPLDAEHEVDDQPEQSITQDSIDNTHPLLFFIDCETTASTSQRWLQRLLGFLWPWSACPPSRALYIRHETFPREVYILIGIHIS